ncbi:MAG: SulP family inorganic anion transporter [Chlamydiia bacterium]
MFSALRQLPIADCFQRAYWRSDFIHDLRAGTTVALVAMPLALAFGIGAGVSPAHGVWTAIIAGFVAALCGGSRFAVTGPTGAFMVILYGIVTRHGVEGLFVAGMLAGLILLALGFLGVGKLIQFVPLPVVVGFTAGIAATIMISQIPPALGLAIERLPGDSIARLVALWDARGTWVAASFFTTAATLAVICAVRHWVPRIPWGIAGVLSITALSILLGNPAKTLVESFGELVISWPSWTMPVQWADLWGLIHKVLPDAFTIAMLGALESLLCALVADGMTGTRHQPNVELVAQGLGNIAGLSLGGIPATGAIARTAANIKAGARSPLASILHSGILWLLVALAGHWAGLIPMAVMAAVLLTVAWNMFEWPQIRALCRAPVQDLAVFLTTFILTILFDLTIAVEVGIVLAVFLFLQRMIQIAPDMGVKVHPIEPSSVMPTLEEETSRHVQRIVIQGPFYFGMAETLREVLRNFEKPPEFFDVHLEQVPFIDATGLRTLQSFIEESARQKSQVRLVGALPKVRATLVKFGLGSYLANSAAIK